MTSSKWNSRGKVQPPPKVCRATGSTGPAQPADYCDVEPYGSALLSGRLLISMLPGDALRDSFALTANDQLSPRSWQAKRIVNSQFSYVVTADLICAAVPLIELFFSITQQSPFVISGWASSTTYAKPNWGTLIYPTALINTDGASEGSVLVGVTFPDDRKIRGIGNT